MSMNHRAFGCKCWHGAPIVDLWHNGSSTFDFTSKGYMFGFIILKDGDLI